MDVTESTKAAAGLAVLKSANKQQELALELLTRTMEGMAGPALPAPAVEVPATSFQGTTIDIQA